jgi:hypothetical protein
VGLLRPHVVHQGGEALREASLEHSTCLASISSFRERSGLDYLPISIVGCGMLQLVHRVIILLLR